MDLRLLLSAAHGVTWFGRWGYVLCLGSFGVTHEAYQRSVDLLSSLDLDGLIREFRKIGREGDQLQRIVLTYRRMAEFDSSGPHRLTTLRDLLRFLLDFKNRKIIVPPAPACPAAENRLRNPLSPLPIPVGGVSLVPLSSPGLRPRSVPVVAQAAQSRRRCRDFEAVAADLDSRWPVRRLRVAAQVIVGALEQHPRGMSRQEVRDAARLTIGDTGLLDFVLKSIGNSIVGTHVVRRTQNPATRVLEFSLEDLPGGGQDVAHPTATPSQSVAAVKLPPAFVPAMTASPESSTVISPRISPPSPSQVEKDTAWVYRHLLLGSRPLAAETVLHGKRWVKEWHLRDEDDDNLRFLCSWLPSEKELTGGHLTRRPLPPPEVLVLPPHATVGDLREEAQRALRDTYCVMDGFIAGTVEGVNGEEWEPLFGCGAESGACVWVRGSGVDLVGAADSGDGQERLLYEGGDDNWTVSCGCGARDDDGERMVACDVCEVWQHTRCAGIADGDAVPRLFLCGSCGHAVLRQVMIAGE